MPTHESETLLERYAREAVVDAAMLEALERDAKCYRYILAGHVYIDPVWVDGVLAIYAEIGDGDVAKHYYDPRDLDIDIGEAIAAAPKPGDE